MNQAFRASPLQELLLLQQSNADALRPLTIIVEINAACSGARLENALCQLVEAHEILRTKTIKQQANVAQIVAPALHAPNGDQLIPEVRGIHVVAETGEPTRITLTLQRCCGDQRSLGLCLAELSSRYLKLHTGQPAIQYADATDALHALVSNKEYDDAHEFWRGELQRMGDSKSVAQRMQKLGRREHSDQTCRAQVDLDLRKFAQQIRFKGTHEELLFSLWCLFVARCDASSSVVTIGAVSSMRSFEHLQGAIGPYDVEFPVTIETNLQRPLIELLQLVANKRRACASRAHYLDPRLLSNSPRMMIGFAHFELPSQLFGGSQASILELSTNNSFAIELQTLGDQHILLACAPHSGLDVHAIASIFGTWVSDSCKRLDAPLGATPIRHMTGGALVSNVDSTNVESRRLRVDTQIAVQSRSSPNACALREGEISISYAELDDCVVSVMAAIAATGIACGNAVAIHLERSRWWTVCSLACWRLGLVIVPIDINETRPRIAHILDNSASKLLLSRTAGSLRDANVLDPTTLTPPAAIATCTLPERQTELAYILYTSGSTGSPKGVAVSHASLAQYLSWASVKYEACNGDALVHSAFSFDFTLTCLWLPLLNGNTTEFFPQTATLSDLFDVLTLTRSDAFIKLTPAHLSAFQTMERDSRRHILWPKHLVTGGAAISFGQLPASVGTQGVTLHNEYGPTEATVGCSDFQIAEYPSIDAPIPIGGPTLSSSFYVLDEYLNLSIAGEIGELFIAGGQLARCYVRKPDLTARSFLPDPYAQVVGGRMYRTGDLVRQTNSNCLEFVGRRDHQVKRLGYRIELAEIDCVLRIHPKVSECHTVATRQPASEPILTSFYVGDGEHNEINSWLSERLPVHLLPNDIVQVPVLWLTTHGKVDEARLLRYAQETKTIVAPTTEMERTLFSVWSQVLKKNQFGVDDNFFNLGGDSIRAIQVVALAGKQGINFAIKDVFELRTIRKLTAICHTTTSDALQVLDTPFALLTTADRSSTQQLALEDAYPISQLQLGMIYHHDAGGSEALYHDIFSYRVTDNIDAGRLSAAIATVVRRHPVLRTTFDLSTYDEPLQLVWRNAEESLIVIDLRNLHEADQDVAIRHWIEGEKKRGFAIGALPLVRFVLHLRGATDFQFTTSFHHAVLDGWSDQILHMEILDEYRALQNDKPSMRAPPRCGYRDFVRQERLTLASPEAKSFWGERLEGYEPFEFQRSSPGVLAGPLYRIDTVPLSSDTVQGLHRIAGELGVPLKSVLLAGHMRVLSLATGRADVITSLVSSGRPELPDGDRVLGLFINSLPFRVKFSGGSWTELISQIYRIEQELMPFRRYPYSEIHKSLGGIALSTSLFYFTHYYESVEHTGGIAIRETIPHEESSFPLVANFNLTPNTGELALRLTCQREFIDERLITRLSELYTDVFRAIGSDSACDYARHASVRPDWHAVNITTSLIPAPLSALDKFLEQVRDRANDIALITESGSYSYRQLDELSNRIANFLLAQRAVTSARVGICLYRDANTIAAILAVFKCGAAFVPLDPTYPAARLSHMCRAANFVLCDERTSAAIRQSGGCEITELDAKQIALCSSDFQPKPVAKHSLAYLLHTSGSTGQPKAVMIEHHSLSNLLADFAARLEFQSGHKFLAATSISFDIALLEILLPLTSGGTLVLAGDRALADPETLVALVNGRNGAIDFVQATPSTWALLRDIGWRPRSPITALCGGEAVSKPVADWLVSCFGDKTWNVYGPTETCIWSSASKMNTDRPISLGRPISGTKLYALDAFLHPVPHGAYGELFIGGVGVSRGYADNRALTAQRFIPDPFGNGERIYRTGDVVRVDNDGELIFSGRVDQQVKIRGQRIELAEIAEHLKLHPDIRDALAVVQRTEARELLVAYIVGRDGAFVNENNAASTLTGPDDTSLRAFLTQSLPAVFLPNYFVQLDAIPKTLNNKTDFRALPAVDAGACAASIPHVPAANTLEEFVGAVWEDTLRISRVSAESSFSNLGGSSLDVMRIVAKLRRELQIEIAVKDAFEFPTPRRFAKHLSSDRFAPHQVARANNLAKIWLMSRRVHDDTSQVVHTVD